MSCSKLKPRTLYQRVWEELPLLKPWLSGAKDDHAYCKFCNQYLRPHLADLKKHATTKKHLDAAKVVGGQKSVASSFSPDFVSKTKAKSKRRELRFALYCACKTSFRALDPLTEIIQSEFGGREALELHRTKCQDLVKKVLAPYFKEDLLKDLACVPFSLMVDESTDISVKKLLAVSVRYFSVKFSSIVTTYLGVTELEQGDAFGLVDGLKKVLGEWEIKAEHFVGLSTDGANVMLGNHKSLLRILQNFFPNLVHLRCSCHSFDLAAKEAVKKALPSHIEYLLRETYNWFAHSRQRQAAYAQIVDLIGVDCMEENVEDINNNVLDEELELEEDTEELQKKRKVLKLLSLSDTRWLVISDCIERVLSQYDALKCHFQVAYEKERCHQAKILHEMFSDETNRLLLLFLHPVLKELRQKTLLFQSNDKDPLRVFQDLEVYFLSLASKFLKNSVLQVNDIEDLCELNIDSEFCMLSDEDVNYGSAFLEKLKTASISYQDKVGMRQRARRFFKYLFSGLQKRLAGAFALHAKIKQFAMPDFKAKEFVTSDFPSPFFPQKAMELAEIEEKCHQVQLQTWKEKNTEKFWLEVHNKQDAAGNFPFRILTSGVLKMLVLPISNSEVERVFSQVTLIKDKKRAGMKTDLLDAILFCRFGLRRLQIRIQDFMPPLSICNYNSTIYEPEAAKKDEATKPGPSSLFNT